MLERVNALLESEGQAIVDNHEDVIVEAMTLVNDFQKEMKSFVLNNPEEFIGESVEDTYKNIRVFSEVATAQYVSEVSNLYGNVIEEQLPVGEEDQGLSEYL